MNLIPVNIVNVQYFFVSCKYFYSGVARFSLSVHTEGTNVSKKEEQYPPHPS